MIELIKQIRQETNLSLAKIKEAVEATNGDKIKALEYLRQKGILSAEKKADRITSQGLIDSYVHNGKIGVLLELNCETDFVAKTDDFKQLAKDICLQIASSAPEYLSLDDISKTEIDKELRIEMGREDIKGKPLHIQAQIAKGRVNKTLNQKVLLKQAFVKDTSLSIEELIKIYINKLGENITLKRFDRFVLGE